MMNGLSPETLNSMLENSPVNTMLATIDGDLIYLNEASKRTLKNMEKYLPEKVDNLVGKSIDIFHKNPAHQRNIISNPKNLPHRAIISVGPEKLDLLVTAIFDSNGKYTGPMVTWEVVTEKLKNEAQITQLTQMINKSPINTMFSTVDGQLIYMNETSKTTLKKLQQYLPDSVDNLVGKSIDIFHKNPAHQRKIISDPKNLPHRAVISLGPEKLDLLVSAITSDKGEYIGAMVTWDLITTRHQLVNDLQRTSDELTQMATGINSVSSSLSAAAEETSAQANNASVAAEEISAGFKAVTGNMTEMVQSIKDISKTTLEASQLSTNATKLATETNSIITTLGNSSNDIGNVIKVISSIAQQTNLLALNATIEAARAGEAGRGFAVVANEVKELAKQTSKATEDITKKIENIQKDSTNAVSAIGKISEAITKINGYTSSIASAVEEQSATTNEVSRVVTESSEGVRQISENIAQVSQAASMTGKDAINAQKSSTQVSEVSERLKNYIKALKV